MWTVPERGGGVNWSVRLTLSSSVYYPDDQQGYAYVRHMASLASLRPGNVSVLQQEMTRIAAPAEKPDRLINIPTPMNIIALLVAIPASPAELAVPLRDCDVQHSTPLFPFFSRPRCAVDCFPG